MMFIYDDGGRHEAGYRGSAGDCFVRAVAIATARPYRAVYNEVNEMAATERRKRGRGKSSARNGVYKSTIQKYLKSLGWQWTPTMFVGQGCRVHLRSDELPGGRIIVSLSKHVTAVIDGIIYDTYDPSREGMRCVYGYWSGGSVVGDVGASGGRIRGPVEYEEIE